MNEIQKKVSLNWWI